MYLISWDTAAARSSLLRAAAYVTMLPSSSAMPEVFNHPPCKIRHMYRETLPVRYAIFIHWACMAPDRETLYPPCKMRRGCTVRS